jgi:polyhydroxyalkanoate synthesis regulator phasin
MCIICVEFEKGRMTAKEARRALGEMVSKVGAKHAQEIERSLREAEQKAVVHAVTDSD